MAARWPRCVAVLVLVRVWCASAGVAYGLWAEENVTAAGVVRPSETEVEEPLLFRQWVFAFARG